MNKNFRKAVAEEKFHGTCKAKSQEVKSPTSVRLVTAAKNLGVQSSFLGSPVYQVPVRL